MCINDNSVAENIYEAIAAADVNSELYAATVIRGEGMGDKALIAGGRIVMTKAGSNFFSRNEGKISGLKDTGIFSLDGRDVYMELQGSEPNVVICGAGHVSMPIISIARMMNLNVTVIDDRREFTDNALRHGANRVICKSFDEGMQEIEGNDDTYFVVVTRGHNYDTACVGGALRKRHAYVGMIGSKRQAEIVREALARDGLSAEQISSIYTPIGLDIGAETPEEIAVAIIAEIIALKNKKRRNIGFPKNVMKAILEKDREPMMLTTIVSKSGSGPRTVGTKMLVRKDGSIIGTIGGGVAENEIIERAKSMLSDGFEGADLVRTNMIARPDEDGMVCGGSVEVLFETV